MNRRLKGLGLLALGLAACTDDASRGSGTVRINLTPEDSITKGLTPGDAVENTKDYAVRYSKYIVVVGNVQLARTAAGPRRESDAIYAVDLTRVGAQGVEIAKFEDMASGEWSYFGYETPVGDASVKPLEVTEDDLTMLVEHGWTHWIEGTLERAEDEGGPLTFVIQTAVPTLFDYCELDGEPGLSVVEDGVSTASITFHGDHLWFNSFPTGSEGSVERRAAWLVAADQDGDAKVSTEDLAALDATEVFTTELGYSLGGTPDGLTIDTALDFVRAQLATQGHFNGEGECSWQYDG